LDDPARRSLEATCLPHLRAAYNLARWLTHDEHDAEDLVQEAFLRAIKYFESGSEVANARAWILKIVRNAFYTSRAQKKVDADAAPFNESVHSAGLDAFSPETAALRESDRELVRAALADLAVEFRETIVLRELEGLAYREIAEVLGVPLGTVMSRLARARAALAESLARRMKKELSP
jgi:RNA polymerase sigma-70 factor (ECF subfamily)